MEAISNFFTWLFTDRTGVLVLIGSGIVIALIVAMVLERKTRERYTNHEKSDDDWSLFDDDESGWSDFENDNH